MITNLLKNIRSGLIALLCVVAIQLVSAAAMASSLAVLLPDDAVLNDPRVLAWRDAADEEGLQLEFITDSQFLQMGLDSQKYKGLILPDQIHPRASDVLVSAIKTYVSQGGRLMLVYDAGSLTDTGFYPPVKSRFSDLVGVDYVLYDELRDFTIGLGPMLGIEKTLWDLQVPPGKSMPFPGAPLLPPQYLQSDASNPGGVVKYDPRLHHELKRWNRDDEQYRQRLLGVIEGPNIKHGDYWPSSSTGSDSTVWSNDYYDRYSSKYSSGSYSGGSSNYNGTPIPQPIAPSTSIYGVSGYVYGFLDYPSFVTRGNYTGTVLLSSMDFGLVAGLSNYGNGKVLFVNTSLTYLKGQTDGMLMHGFLHFFGANLLKLPRLANHPQGRGGIVLNWHVDDGSAIPAVKKLYSQGIWNRGPYSIHFTVGPDAVVPGDGLGMDIKNNSTTQGWVRYLAGKKHQIGSHGGWVHDYYGINVNEFNEAQFKPFLEMNKQAIEYVTQRPITEYSAPMGNNPIWALNWLEQNGILGYYFAGHTGMGPTRAYREGKLMNPEMWAFPVSTLGEYATFEEFSEYGVSDAEVTRWLSALVDFSVYNRTSRLIYFHPPGAVDHPDVMQSLMDRTDAYEANRKFKWYTMTDLAEFMKSRQKVSWQIIDGYYGRKNFIVTHPDSLANQTLLLPKLAYDKPYIQKGYARVEDDNENWLVIAEPGRELKFSSKPLN